MIDIKNSSTDYLQRTSGTFNNISMLFAGKYALGVNEAATLPETVQSSNLEIAEKASPFPNIPVFFLRLIIQIVMERTHIAITR